MNKPLILVAFINLILLHLSFADIDPAKASEFIEQGDAARKALNDESALQLYEKALSWDSTNYEAAWKLARSYVDAGDAIKEAQKHRLYYKKANEFSRRAVELNPDGSKGHLYLSIAIGKVALEEGPRERIRLSPEIKREAEKAIELNPGEDIAWHVLGRWNYRVATLSWIERKFAQIFYGDVPEGASIERAAECFKKAIEINPDVISHHLELGLTYEALHQKDSAIQEFQRVLDLPVFVARDKDKKAEAQKHLSRLK